MYYQKSRSIDDYLDEFVELVVEAGYTDPKTTVASPYEAAKNVNQN